jgi:hypothetical protein
MGQGSIEQIDGALQFVGEILFGGNEMVEPTARSVRSELTPLQIDDTGGGSRSFHISLRFYGGCHRKRAIIPSA